MPTARACRRTEGQNASCVLKHDRILNECNSILIKAFRFEKFEICLLKRILDLNVIAARLEEFRKYDRTSNRACVRQVLALDAVESSLVTAQGNQKQMLSVSAAQSTVLGLATIGTDAEGQVDACREHTSKPRGLPSCNNHRCVGCRAGHTSPVGRALQGNGRLQTHMHEEVIRQMYL